MKLLIATHDCEPCRSTLRSTGHGEGIRYQGHTYFYRSPHWIPKNRVSYAMREHSYRSRQRGDREYVIVAPRDDHYVVLEHRYTGVREAMKFYADMTPEQAIENHLGLLKMQQEWYDAQPKCKCGSLLITFEEGQRDDECYSCFLKRSKSSTSEGRGTAKKSRSATGRLK